MNSLAAHIDHTLLKPDATLTQIEQLCKEARENHFFSVCVNSSYVPFCKKNLAGSNTRVCAVIGFPLGAMSPEVKAFETKWCVENGADEIDMVLHVGALKEGRNDYVRNDIRGVVQAAQGKTVKVIIETALLTNEEKSLACRLSQEAKAHFVKTCSGFSGGGATIEDVKLMKAAVGEDLQVKASGGIRDLASAKAMLAAGASRLGTSSGIVILKNQLAVGDY